MMVYGEPFLRSVNLQFDAEEPHRISHYVPTAKCAPLIQSLLGKEEDRAFFIVAPYGSGKSLTALYLLHLIEKQSGSEEVLQVVEGRLKDVNPELAKYASSRRRNQKRGLTVTLHGYVPSIPEALKEGIIASLKRVKLGRQASSKEIDEAACSTMDEASQFLTMIRQKFAGKGIDRVTILWDEFGKHLETLLVEGRPKELLYIQTLAEVVSRSRKIPLTLGLFLHQGLLHYVGSMSQSVRSEWTKIEGRFRTIQYVDDSKELYRLIGDVVLTRKGYNASSIDKIELIKIAEQTKNLGLFSDFNQEELVGLLGKTYPLNPITVYLLPRLSARVAQNERTLFNFLYSCPFDTEVFPWHLFDYFAPQMRADIAVGGTYRQWLETQSALSKVSDDLPAIQALKTACLLGLGLFGDRSRTGRELLQFSLHGYSHDTTCQTVVEDLISRNLLLYRKHNDEISIWHGTDLDIRGRLEEEKQRQRGQFDLLNFLSEEAPPWVWRPNEYNSVFGVRRYFISEYHSLDSIAQYLQSKLADELLPSACDGKVLYFIADNPEDLKAGRKLVIENNWNERLVVVIPREPVPLFEAALEVYCLGKLQIDSELVGTDPMALPEIEQMTEDARRHLDKLLGNILNPSSNGPIFYNSNIEKSCTSPRDFRRYLSALMLRAYNSTPIISNELIVRKRATGTIVNSRKKLLIGILERSGQEQLGLQGNFPDSSMFRTVLLNTGIYQKQKSGDWGYVFPDQLPEASKGMKRVWELIQKFFTETSDKPKNAAVLFESLRMPPFGVRDGLFPILFAAGYKAFPQAISIRTKGEYLEDLQPSDIEALCKNPGLYEIDVFGLDEGRKEYLETIWSVFRGDDAESFYEKDLIRKCFEALESWLGELPSAWETTKKLTPGTKRVRDAIANESDPVPLFFKKLPKAIGADFDNCGFIKKQLLDFRIELEGIVIEYRYAADRVMRSALALGKDNGQGVLMETCARWAQCFSNDFVKSLSDGIASGLISRMKLPYETDANFIDSISTLLIGEGLSDWDDGTEFVFDRELRNVVKRVEDYALTTKCGASVEGTATVGVSQLAEGRLIELTERLMGLAGKEKTKEILQAILGRIS